MFVAIIQYLAGQNKLVNAYNSGLSENEDGIYKERISIKLVKKAIK